MRPITKARNANNFQIGVINIHSNEQILPIVDNFFDKVRDMYERDVEKVGFETTLIPIIEDFSKRFEEIVFPYILDKKEIFKQKELRGYGYDVFSFVESMYEPEDRANIDKVTYLRYADVNRWNTPKKITTPLRLRNYAKMLYSLIMRRDYVHNSVLGYIPFLFNYIPTQLAGDIDPNSLSTDNPDEDFLWINQFLIDLITKGSESNNKFFNPSGLFEMKHVYIRSFETSFNLNTKAVESIELGYGDTLGMTEPPLSFPNSDKIKLFARCKVDENGVFGIELSDEMALGMKGVVSRTIPMVMYKKMGEDFDNVIKLFDLDVPPLVKGKNEVDYVITFYREMYKYLLGLIR